MSSRGADQVERIYKSKTDDERTAAYDDWAEDYDADLVGLGYRTPGVVAGFFGRYVPRDAAPILDAGAGTGFLGEALTVLGYGGLVAVDLSEGMLKVAGRKGIYDELRQMRLGGPLDFADDHFAAATSIGTFTAGHAKADSLDELIRITRPGGHMIFSIRTDDPVGDAFIARQEEHEQAGRWRLAEATEPYQCMPIGEPHVLHRVYAYEIL